MASTVSTDQSPNLIRIEREIETERIRLEAIEIRLGTENEGDRDFEDAREIAHQLSNLQLLYTLTKTRPT